MATAKLILDKRRKDNNLIDVNKMIDLNRYPLNIRLYKDDLYRDIRLKYKFSTGEWIEGENRVGKTFINSGRVNSSIQKRLSITTTVLSEFERNIANMKIDDVRDFVINEIEKQMNPTSEYLDTQAEKIDRTPKELKNLFLEKFGLLLIERTRKKEKFGTAKWYEDGIKALKKFNDDKDILLSNITVSFLENFEAEHISRGYGVNGLSAYLRAIRSVTNYAIKEVLKGKRFDGYPWGSGGYSIQHEKTKKRAVKKDIITEIRGLALDKEIEPGSWDARNYLLFMFNNRGMNFIDIAKLKKNQITEAKFKGRKIVAGRLEYKRSKNGKDFSIKLTKESLEILNAYNLFEKIDVAFVFPIGYENTKIGLAHYMQKRKRINEYFRGLAAKIGEKELNITTYVIRHSWATIAKKSGVSVAMIGDGLGHEDSKTTEIYLEDFTNEILDDANELIVA